jgi:tRNA threonylcarbamoyladenosine biosynthesis protein TsaE
MAALPVTRRIDGADEAALGRLAGALAARVRAGDTIALWGDLGAGKTAFARAFLRALGRRHGIVVDDVPSPTFTLAQIYELGPDIVWHVDLYRLSSPDEAVELGLEEALAGGILVIEWPDRLGKRLPVDRLDLSLAPSAAPDLRDITLTGGPSWDGRLDGIGGTDG